MAVFLENLNKREKIVLAAGTVFLFLAVLYGLVIAPFYNDLKRQRQEVPKKRETLNWMMDAARQVENLRAGSKGRTPAGGGSHLTVIEQTAKQFRLDRSLKRVEPKEQNSVRVWLEDAMFEDIFLWLKELEKDYGISVSSITSERRDAPGYVNARIVLQGAGE